MIDPAVVSVIVSGCVAIAGIVLPVLVTSLVSWSRVREEQKSAQREHILSTSKLLLEALASYRFARNQGVAEEILVRLYAWELAVRGVCKGHCRNRLLALRASFSTTHLGQEQNLDEMVNEIIELTGIALEQEDKPSILQRWRMRGKEKVKAYET